MRHHPRLLVARLSGIALGACALSSLGHGQMVFSIDWHSASVGLPDSWTGVPITEGDLLTPNLGVPSLGPLLTPGIAISAGPTGLRIMTYPGLVEVDAVSLGADYPMNNMGAYPGDYVFSTDEFAIGVLGPWWPPDLSTEAPPGDSAADLWINPLILPPGPLPPFAAMVGHTGLVDGNGMPSGSGLLYPGTGLLEPTFPGPPPDLGDTLDAVDLQTPPGSVITNVWFSLDSAFIDPMIGVPNSGSAMANGFSGADILLSGPAGALPMVWAPAMMLGLDLYGFGTDDLDALALWENGTGAFEPSVQPYDWLSGATDMVLFSVRRGSLVIGRPDSIFGMPIEEGDILTTPLVGGFSPFPGIFCAAENLGLATTRTMGVMFGDDLDALDTLHKPIFDCNGNAVEDAIDIATGTSPDGNMNGIPDECELLATPYCFCAAGAPCGNVDPNAGCANSTGVGALMSASGSSSVSADNLVLTVSQLPINAFAFMFRANNAIGPFPFGDGFRCAGGGLIRFGVQNSGMSGTISRGPGLCATYGIAPFTTYRFHCWYRDPAGPCGSGFNTPNAIAVSFLP